MCNAWDEHIKKGITDQPIIVNLDEESMSIEDHGRGIHDDDIQPIYMIYGNSTKKNSQNETGGFGLGSKAPFAYSSHFTVTSSHKGMQHIYAMSRGSHKTNGKPDCRTIMSMPTDQSGIKVEIPLNESHDHFEFKRIIEYITFFGDMNVCLNGEILPTAGFDDKTENFILIKMDDNTPTARLDFSAPIYVRYGSVIYPVARDSEYADLYDKVSQLNRQRNHSPYGNNHSTGHRILIFQAPPDSISVTPSRESLSMTDTTKNTISENLQRIVSSMESVVFSAFNELMETYIKDQLFRNDTIHVNELETFLMRGYMNPHATAMQSITEAIIDSTKSMMKLMMLYQQKFDDPKSITFVDHKKRIMVIFAHLIKVDPKRSSVYRAMKEEILSGSKLKLVEIWNNAIISELRLHLKHNQGTLRAIESSGSPFTSHVVGRDSSIFRSNMYDPNTVVVAHSQYGIQQGASDARLNNHFFAVLIKRTKGLADEVLGQLKGFHHVEDATKYKIERYQKPKDAKKRAKGYAALKSLISDKGKYKVGWLSSDNLERIQDPKYVFVERQKNLEKHLDGFEHSAQLNQIHTLLPESVVVSTDKTLKRLVEEKGAEEGESALIKRVGEIFESDREAFLWPWAMEHGTAGSDVTELNLIADHDDYVSRYLKRRKVDDPLIKAAVSILGSHKSRYYGFNYKWRDITEKVEKACRLYVDTDPVFLKIRTNTLLDGLELNLIRRKIEDKSNVDQYLKLLKYTLSRG